MGELLELPLLIFIESPNKSDSYEGRMDFLTLIWVGTKKKQWHLLLELLSSGEIRRGCISKLEERLQLDYHFSLIAALLLESCVHYNFRKCACPAGSDSGLF